ncbi:hypothetical protein ACIBI9_37810 [Nonomuraea sp. NPDC050451]|uniref:hypothetical protein n=1 Tax=Nonomuraea sp. NPDC050451 TaxID=3364364 RepID=UPI0037A80E7A
MLSRSKRIFGIAILGVAAATAVAVPAHAYVSKPPAVTGLVPYQLMSVVRAPLCFTTGALSGETKLGVPLVEELLPQLADSCAAIS